MNAIWNLTQRQGLAQSACGPDVCFVHSCGLIVHAVHAAHDYSSKRRSTVHVIAAHFCNAYNTLAMHCQCHTESHEECGAHICICQGPHECRSEHFQKHDFARVSASYLMTLSADTLYLEVRIAPLNLLLHTLFDLNVRALLPRGVPPLFPLQRYIPQAEQTCNQLHRLLAVGDREGSVDVYTAANPMSAEGGRGGGRENEVGYHLLMWGAHQHPRAQATA